MEPSPPSAVLSSLERTRLADRLAGIPAGRLWAVAHRHGPLLCALGLLGSPDPAYTRAALRHFHDPGETRRRALALLDELDREAHDERYEQERQKRRRRFRFSSFSRAAAPPDDDPAEQLPRSA